MKKNIFQFLSEFLIHWMTLPMRTFLLLGIKPWPRTSIRNIFCWKRLFFFIIKSLTRYWFVNASYSHKSYDNNIFIFPLKNINGKLSIYSQEWERRESAIRTHAGDRGATTNLNPPPAHQCAHTHGKKKMHPPCGAFLACGCVLLVAPWLVLGRSGPWSSSQ